tara:strand:- start:356 stop:478 length:123 start_codon:yes stop_codon:yes gene_type:complete
MKPIKFSILVAIPVNPRNDGATKNKTPTVDKLIAINIELF